MNTKHVISDLDYSLKALGFKRKRSCWNRRIDDVVEVIDVQTSKSGDTVTVNAGVLDPTVHKLIWGEEPPDFVEEPFATVRARIGDLLDQKDRWWPLSSEAGVSAVLSAVTEVVLPFLQRMHDRGEMVSWLSRAGIVKRRQPPEVLGLAILMNGLGRHSEACKLIAAQRDRKIGAWHGRYDEVAQRLGCIPDDPSAPPVA